MGNLLGTPSFSGVNMSNAKTIAEDAIAANKVMVFSATVHIVPLQKKILNKHGIPFQVIELDIVQDGAAIQDYLHQKTGQKTVPNIFVKQKHLGGDEHLEELEAKGTLKQECA
ncbi:Glutaredoxin-1 [Rhizoclosmatium sp. JEL0117]|nr:Glutaredoxin-1 [Rhizoclosmatium sp. JEL0117]